MRCAAACANGSLTELDLGLILAWQLNSWWDSPSAQARTSRRAPAESRLSAPSSDGWRSMASRATVVRQVRGINYQFGSFEELSLLLEAGGDEQDLELPLPGDEFADADWVVTSFVIGADKTSVAACVVDRGNGLRLAFEDRDWQSLWQFAHRRDPPEPSPTTIPPPPPSSETVSAGGSHVLVIDSDEETQMVVRELLQSSGYATSAVSSAEAAFDALRRTPVDLVLVEWTLPGMNGPDFCRRVRRDRKWRGVPVMFLSIHSTSQHIMQAFEAGADDYITKPFHALELAARVMGLIRRAKMPPHPG